MEFKIRMEGKIAFLNYDDITVKVEKGRILTVNDTGALLQGEAGVFQSTEDTDYYIFEAVNDDGTSIYEGIKSKDIYHYMDFFFNELLNIEDFTITVPQFSVFNNEIGELPANF